MGHPLIFNLNTKKAHPPSQMRFSPLKLFYKKYFILDFIAIGHIF